MSLNFRFRKISAGLTFFFFLWQAATAYCFPASSLRGHDDRRTVIVLLNAHTSSDAQRNIAETLKILQSQGIDLIGLEGADGPIEGEYFRKFPFKDALSKATWQMVREGIFTGAEYFYITADQVPSLYGLENRELYLENQDAFVKTVQAREALSSVLESFTSSIQALKQRVYSKRLFGFDRLVRQTGDGDIRFMDYVSGMIDTRKQAHVSLLDFPNLYALSKALEKEKKISKDKLGEELERMREILAGLSPESDAGSNQRDVALRPKGPTSLRGGQIRNVGAPLSAGGRIRPTVFGGVGARNQWSDYQGRAQGPPLHLPPRKDSEESLEHYQKTYAYFSELIKQGKLNPKDFKHFSRYFDWLSSMSELDSEKLFDELDSFTELLYERFAKSEREKALVTIAKQFELFEKMLSIQLTQKEWKEKQIFNAEAILSFLGRELKDRAPEINPSQIQALYDAHGHAQRFYHVAEKRNEVFAEKIIRAMSRARKNVSVIVVGGFHEEGLKSILESKGLSTIFITPRINGALSDIPYFDRMMGKPTQLTAVLDQLVSGLERALVTSGIVAPGEKIKVGLAQHTRAAITSLLEAKPADRQTLSEKINRASDQIKIKPFIGGEDPETGFLLELGIKGKSVTLSVKKPADSDFFEITEVQARIPETPNVIASPVRPTDWRIRRFGWRIGARQSPGSGPASQFDRLLRPLRSIAVTSFSGLVGGASLLVADSLKRSEARLLEDLIDPSLLTEEQRGAYALLISLDQGHLFDRWVATGKDVDRKINFFNDILHYNKTNPHGGLAKYWEVGKKMLQNAKTGADPLKMAKGEPAEGLNLREIDAEYQALEDKGLYEANALGFVEVAGGVGDRLKNDWSKGLPKVEIPLSLITGMTHLEKDIGTIHAFVQKSNRGKGENKMGQFFMMTSDENHWGTESLLSRLGFRKKIRTYVTGGVPKKREVYVSPKFQVEIRLGKQDAVPAFQNNTGHFVTERDNPYRIVTKPHGHGDIHSLLYRTGTAEDWEAMGIKHTVFFQDSNASVVNAILPGLGLSYRKGLDINYLATARELGEPMGMLMRVSYPDGRVVTRNVEYSYAKQGVVEEKPNADGKSIYPGNLNVFIVDHGKYTEVLRQTKGVMAELINPKYTDATKETFAPARPETNMQDLTESEAARSLVVGVTSFAHKRLWFAPTKNDDEKGASEIQAGRNPDTMDYTETAWYWLHRKILSEIAGVKIQVEPSNPGPLGLFVDEDPARQGAFKDDLPAVEWDRWFAATTAEVKGKFKNVEIQNGSVLSIFGENVRFENVTLMGALIVNVPQGSSLTIRGVSIQNRGHRFVKLNPAELNDPSTPEELRSRRYKVIDQDKALVLDLTKMESGDYVYDLAGLHELSRSEARSTGSGEARTGEKQLKPSSVFRIHSLIQDLPLLKELTDGLKPALKKKVFFFEKGRRPHVAQGQIRIAISEDRQIVVELSNPLPPELKSDTEKPVVQGLANPPGPVGFYIWEQSKTSGSGVLKALPPAIDRETLKRELTKLLKRLQPKAKNPLLNAILTHISPRSEARGEIPEGLKKTIFTYVHQGEPTDFRGAFPTMLEMAEKEGFGTEQDILAIYKGPIHYVRGTEIQGSRLDRYEPNVDSVGVFPGDEFHIQYKSKSRRSEARGKKQSRTEELKARIRVVLSSVDFHERLNLEQILELNKIVDKAWFGEKTRDEAEYILKSYEQSRGKRSGDSSEQISLLIETAKELLKQSGQLPKDEKLTGEEWRYLITWVDRYDDGKVLDFDILLTLREIVDKHRSKARNKAEVRSQRTEVRETSTVLTSDFRLPTSVFHRLSQRESMTLFVRLPEDVVEAVASINGMPADEIWQASEAGDQKLKPILQFYEAFALFGRLCKPVTFIVSDEGQRSELRQAINWYFLNGEREPIKLPAGGRLSVESFASFGEGLAQEIGRVRIGELYYLTDLGEANWLAPRFSEANFIVTNALAGNQKFVSGPDKIAALAVALFRQIQDQIVPNPNIPNLFLPTPAVFERWVDSLTTFKKAVDRILTQA